MLDSGNGIGAVVFESALVSPDFVCSEFPDLSKIDGPPTIVTDFERSQYQDVWNNFADVEFRALWNKRFLTPEKGELTTNAMQASPSSLDRVSLQASLLCFLRLSHAGEPHRRAGKVPPRLRR